MDGACRPNAGEWWLVSVPCLPVVCVAYGLLMQGGVSNAITILFVLMPDQEDRCAALLAAGHIEQGFVNAGRAATEAAKEEVKHLRQLLDSERQAFMVARTAWENSATCTPWAEPHEETWAYAPHARKACFCQESAPSANQGGRGGMESQGRADDVRTAVGGEEAADMSDVDQIQALADRSATSAPADAETGLRMGLDEEIAAVRGMKVAEIKQELVQRGLSTDDMVEKNDFVKRLAEARVRGRGGGPEASNPSAANLAQDRGAVLRAEISAMQISVIKAQLAELGVAAQGLVEKSEFVELLVRARLDAPAGRRADGGSSSELKDVQTKIMPGKEAAQPMQPGAGGSPFGEMGAGMPNPFAGGDTRVGGGDDAELKCAWAYGDGAYFDGEMCSCRSGFTNEDGRCQKSEHGRDGDPGASGSHDDEYLASKEKGSRTAVLAKTGAKAVTGVVLCTVMWDATALLGNPLAVPGLVDNALCGALAGLGLFGTR